MRSLTATSALFFTLLCLFTSSCVKSTETTSPPSAQKYKSTGVIKAIDPAGSKVTIDHKDIPGFMSAMEMSFPVANATILGGFSVGDHVAFDLEKINSRIGLIGMTKIAESDSTANGEQLFAANCAECHGAKGEGAKKGIPLISGHALAHSEEEYFQQVVKGEPNKMPAFRDKLSDEQIAAIVKYVRTVIQADVKPEQRSHHH